MICVGAGGTGGDEGGAAAEAATDGNIAADAHPQAGHGQTQLGKHSLIGDHGEILLRGVFRLHAVEEQTLRHLLEGQGIIERQRQPQGVEAGA